VEFAENNSDADTSMDAIIFFACTLALNLKYFCISANRGKLAKNINAAIADWSSAKNNEKSYKIMKKHASESRLCTFFILYSAYICGSLYVLSVIFINLKEIFLQDQMNVSNGNVIFL